MPQFIQLKQENLKTIRQELLYKQRTKAWPNLTTSSKLDHIPDTLFIDIIEVK